MALLAMLISLLSLLLGADALDLETAFAVPCSSSDADSYSIGYKEWKKLIMELNVGDYYSTEVIEHLASLHSGGSHLVRLDCLELRQELKKSDRVGYLNLELKPAFAVDAKANGITPLVYEVGDSNIFPKGLATFEEIQKRLVVDAFTKLGRLAAHLKGRGQGRLVGILTSDLAYAMLMQRTKQGTLLAGAGKVGEKEEEMKRALVEEAEKRKNSVKKQTDSSTQLYYLVRFD